MNISNGSSIITVRLKISCYARKTLSFQLRTAEKKEHYPDQMKCNDCNHWK